MFELALGFLANPCNLWTSGHLADRRCALNLVFSDRLTYCRNQGFQTPKTSIIFKALEEIGTGNFSMAEGASFRLTSQDVQYVHTIHCVRALANH